MAKHTHTSSTQLVIPASETAERMSIACANFGEVLTPELRMKAEFSFEELIE